MCVWLSKALSDDGGQAGEEEHRSATGNEGYGVLAVQRGVD